MADEREYELDPAELADILLLQERYGLQEASPLQLWRFATEYGQLLHLRAMQAEDDDDDDDDEA